MSQLTTAFSETYAAQTEAVGSALVATIGAKAADKPALITQLDSDIIIVAGGVAEAGGLELQMLVSDFSTAPAKLDAVTALGQSLEILEFKTNNGIYYIIAGKFAAE